MLQGIKHVNHYPGVSLFMVTWQHGVAGFCADHSGFRCTEDLLAIWPGSGCNLLGEEGKQFMRVKCGKSGQFLAACSDQLPSVVSPCLVSPLLTPLCYW